MLAFGASLAALPAPRRQGTGRPEALSMGNGRRNVVCLKWETLYGHEHVNRLYRGVGAT